MKKNKIYSPIYNPTIIPSNEVPAVYNANGEKMNFYFLRDKHTAHDPHGNNGKYFIWDRYNYGLDVHFYSHNAMLETMGKPLVKYGMLCESPAIVPKDYKIFKKYIGLNKEFNLIFTYDDTILNEIENARFVPFCARVWYGQNEDKEIEKSGYKLKSKDISIVSSNKEYCDLHRIRKRIAIKFMNSNLVDTYGNFASGSYITIDESLKPYRFSFAIENSISDYFFSEKITNCFAAQAIPIYIGARKISQFFNKDGIIEIGIKDIDSLEDIVRTCTENEYLKRLPAVLENYEKVQKYINIQDYIFEQYLK